MTLCNITGVVQKPDGAPLANAVLEFLRLGPGVSGFGSIAIVAQPILATLNGSGEIDANFLHGSYAVQTTGPLAQPKELIGKLVVPNEATAIFGQILEQPSPLENGLIAQAIEAANAASASATAAASSASAAAASAASIALPIAIASGGTGATDAAGALVNLGIELDNNITSVAALLADTDLTYTAGQPKTVAEGDIIRTRAEGFAYEVAASSATDHHVTTAGGVKLYVQRTADGYDVRAFGAVGDGVTDDSAAFITARTAASGAKIRVPAATWKLNSVLTGSEDLVLEGDGYDTVLDFTGTITGGNYGLDAIGTATQIENLGAVANVGESSITLASAPSLSVGDVFFIYNPTDFSWSPWRSVYRAGEWCEVLGVSGNTVTLRNPLYDTYQAADVDLYKVTGPKVELRNFEIRGTTILGLVKISLCVNSLIENVKGTNENNSVVYFDRCYKTSILNADLSNKGDGGDDYGVVFGNSQQGKLIGGNFYARRHAIAIGGANSVGSVSNRDLKFIGATLKNAPASSTEAADMHGNMEGCEYIGCTIYGGGLMAGKNNRYVDCKIFANPVTGYCLYAGEIVGGRIGAQGCEFTTHTDPIAIGRGIIDFGGNSNAISANVLYDMTAYVENCKVYGRNLSASTTFLRLRLSGATVKTNIVVDGLIADVDAISSVIRTNVTSGTPDADFIIVDRVSNFPSGTLLHDSAAGAYHPFPHRCQRQTGSQIIATVIGSNLVNGTLLSFRYVYPRVPAAQIGGVVAFAGNVAPIPAFATLSASQVQPRLISPSATNWAAAINVTAGWSVAIDEV